MEWLALQGWLASSFKIVNRYHKRLKIYRLVQRSAIKGNLYYPSKIRIMKSKINFYVDVSHPYYCNIVVKKGWVAFQIGMYYFIFLFCVQSNAHFESKFQLLYTKLVPIFSITGHIKKLSKRHSILHLSTFLIPH